MQNARRNPRRSNGQSLVEFAFAIPFLLMCVLAIIYFGKAFYTLQILSYAAQEGARYAATVPNLSDQTVRDNVRGFTMAGDPTNTSSVIYNSIGAANLLSNGTSGNLPPGAVVKILPWDGDGSAQDTVQPGTIAVRIDYPYSLLINPFTGKSGSDVSAVSIPLTVGGTANPVAFPDFKMSEKATVAMQIFQQTN